MNSHFGGSLFITTALVILSLGATPSRGAQVAQETGPAETLAAALSAACRADQAQFSNYLTADNAAAFRTLPAARRAAFLKRFALADGVGKPLLSSNSDHISLLCAAPEVTVEFRFGDVRMHENLAFVPVTVVNGEQTEFGLVRENGGWHLLSLGLVLLDVPQLSKQWAEQELASNEKFAAAALGDISTAIGIYSRAFGKMPASLAQLGPAQFNEVSPDQAALIDGNIAAGSESGYQFRYRTIPGPDGKDDKFEVSATPQDYGKTGRRSFLLDRDGKIHVADKKGSTASSDDPVFDKSAAESNP